MTKEEALLELEKPLYTPQDLNTDKEYVLKKFGMSESEFESIMLQQRRDHEDFKTDTRIKEKYMNLLKRTQRIRKAFKKLE